MASADDGGVDAQGANYATLAPVHVDTTNPALHVIRAFSNPAFTVSVALVRFDTSTLPDNANVNSAAFVVFPTQVVSEAPVRSFQGEWYSANNWPIDAGDWTLAPASTAFSAPLNTITPNASNSIALSNLSNVNVTGSTGLRLSISGGQPSGPSQMVFAGRDNGAQVPKLHVCFNP